MHIILRVYFLNTTQQSCYGSVVLGVQENARRSNSGCATRGRREYRTLHMICLTKTATTCSTTAPISPVTSTSQSTKGDDLTTGEATALRQKSRETSIEGSRRREKRS
ncbi:unnamed protein product [Pylaiella littoralis]